MRKAVLKKFQRVFEHQKRDLLFHDQVISEDYNVNQDDRMDELDQASSDVVQSMRLRLRNREILYVKKINEALNRITDGTFGLCSVCEEPIEIRRLEARPTATHCVACKEDQERKEFLSASGLKHKSLGDTMRRMT